MWREIGVVCELQKSRLACRGSRVNTHRIGVGLMAVWAWWLAAGVLSSVCWANGGFEVPCLVGGDGLEIKVSTVKVTSFPSGYQRTRFEYVFYLGGFGNPPFDSISLVRDFIFFDSSIQWRIISGGQTPPDFETEQPPLPAPWPDRLNAFSACSSATPAMLGVMDWTNNGSSSSFAVDMEAMFTVFDTRQENHSCWSDIRTLLGEENGGIGSDAVSTAARDGVRCTTASPVTFFDGAVQLSTQDLQGLRTDGWFGHRRAYHNRLSQPYDGPNGFNWTVHQAPYLVQESEGSTNYVVAMFDGDRAVWFQDTGSGFVPRFGEQHVSLVHQPTQDQYVLTQQNGFHAPGSRSAVTELAFHDFDQPVDVRGLVKRYTDTAGDDVLVDSYGIGQIEALTRTLSDATQERIEYTYYDETSVNERRLQYVTYTRLPAGQTTWLNISRAEYGYYGDTDPDGLRNDLKVVTSHQYINGSWTAVARSHYRYWKDGQQDYSTKGVVHGLKYVIGPAAYQRMIDSGINDPLTATATQVADHADNYFEYDPATGRVTHEIASAGCAGCGAGTTGDSFAYTDNTDANYTDGYNHWKRKTTVTHPDGLVEVIYLNDAGQVMMRVYQESTDQWSYFYKYDSQGRQVLAASPSAVDLQANLATHEGHLDLLNENGSGNYQYLKDSGQVGTSQGLIAVSQYDPASGQLSASKVQQGEGGSPITIQEYQYTATVPPINGHTLYPLTKIKSYPTAGGSAVETSFSYGQWHATGTQFKSRTTTLPVITTSQNGPGAGGSVIQEEFDQDGNVTWRQDERGYITHFKYRTDLNVIQQRINDVDMTDGSLPVGKPAWTTPVDGGKHLVTDFEYDDLGRLTKTVGVEHEIENGGSPATVRPVDWRVYKINGPAIDDEVRTASGISTGSTESLVDPIRVVRQDKAGQLTESITVARAAGVSGALTVTEDVDTQTRWRRWTTTQRNAKNQVGSIRVYHDIASLAYSQTKFAYDAMGRRSRVETPDGTITRTQYDGRGRVTQTWTGTADSCDCGDWDPATQNVNLVLVAENQYDDQDNLTQIASYPDTTQTRVTSLAYDWRNRRVTEDGAVDRFAAMSYDNLDRLIQVDQHDTTAAGNLTTRRQSRYDDLGRVYQTVTYEVDPLTGSVGNSLTSNTWYDASGNAVKTRPGGTQRFTKHVYDSLERLAETYIGFDSGDSSHADANHVIGDTIVQQTQTTYDDAGNVVTVAKYDRRHDNFDDTGPLTTANARVTYQAFWHDGLGRQVASVNYGTNDDTVLTRPSTVPVRSDTVLVHSVAYNDAGDVSDRTDPAGIQTQSTFDDAGRLTQVMENYTDGDPTTGNADQDRTTQFTYTLDGQIKTQTAKMPNTADDQVTTYVYGVTPASGSDLDSHRLLRAVIYPDSDDPADLLSNGTDGFYDRVEFTYNRLGQVTQRQDQRQTVHQMSYDALGRLTDDAVTGLGTADPTVRRIGRTYDVRGLLASLTSYDSVSGGNALNQIMFEYNGFGQLVREYQEHNGVKDIDTPWLGYGYEDGSDNQTLGIRATTVTYPNGRVIQLAYAGSDIDRNMSRVNRLFQDGLGTPNGSIVTYSYLGLDTVVQKEYPTSPSNIRLDYADSVTGTYTGLDRFNRIQAQRWVDTGTTDRMHVQHGYDRVSNRLYADHQVYRSSSQVHTYDNLRRLTQSQVGQIKSDRSGIASHWLLDQRSWDFDPLGNPLGLDTVESTDRQTHTLTSANELDIRYVKGDKAKEPLEDTFQDSATQQNWTSIGSETVSVSAGLLTTVGSLTADSLEGHTESEPRAVYLTGEDVGPMSHVVQIRFATGTTQGQAGCVFGYKSANDYWIDVLDVGAGERRIYHVVNGDKGAPLYAVATTIKVGSGTYTNLFTKAKRRAINFLTVADGFPSGRTGVYADTNQASFVWFASLSGSRPVALTDRWISYPSDWNSRVTKIDPVTDRLQLNGFSESNLRPILLRGVCVDRFEAIFSAKWWEDGANHDKAYFRFMFHSTDQDDYDYLHCYLRSTPLAPLALEVEDGAWPVLVTGTQYTSRMPAMTANTTVWFRVTSDGSQVKVYAKDALTEPSTWSDLSDLVYETTDLSFTGGLIGFSGGATYVAIDDLTVKADRNGDGTYETIEHVESFTLDGNGYDAQTLTYDQAGNLTYDGVYTYSYDAWHRLVRVTKTYAEAPNVLQNGSTVAELSYDGRGRRIVKAVQNSADLNATYVYYYDDQSLVELRNGSDQVLKQHVWGNLAGGYVDELVQLAVNGDPIADPQFAPNDPDHDFRGYYPLHDANFNVLGLVDDQGDLVERYEYRPYGERQVYLSSGVNDPDVLAPTQLSRRVETYGWVTQPYGLNEFGHQGLLHDEETGLVYNRARMLHPRLGRFMQRDPLEYIDGSNLYEYVRSNPVTSTDPLGLRRGRAAHVRQQARFKLAWQAYHRELARRQPNRSKNGFIYDPTRPPPPPESIPWERAPTQDRTVSGFRELQQRIQAAQRLQQEQLRASRVIRKQEAKAPCPETTRKAPGQFDGVRQLSQTLRDAGVPRADRLDTINSFREGTIVVRQATGNENLIRFFGNGAAEQGRFLTRSFPQGNARSRLALPPENSASGLTQFNLRPGATFFEGTVAPNFGRPGGGTQIFVPDSNNLVTP